LRIHQPVFANPSASLCESISQPLKQIGNSKGRLMITLILRNNSSLKDTVSAGKNIRHWHQL